MYCSAVAALNYNDYFPILPPPLLLLLLLLLPLLLLLLLLSLVLNLAATILAFKDPL